MVFGFFEAHRFAMWKAESGGRREGRIRSARIRKASRENIEVTLLANGKPLEGNNQLLLLTASIIIGPR